MSRFFGIDIETQNFLILNLCMFTVHPVYRLLGHTMDIH